MNSRMLPLMAGDGKDTCVQEFAASVDLNASPPATTQSEFGWKGSITNGPRPAPAGSPATAVVQVAPPSALLNRAPEPYVFAYTVEGFEGSITIEISSFTTAGGAKTADEKCRPPSTVLKTTPLKLT